MASTVSLVQCKTYEEQTVADAVRRAIDLLGGMSSFVQPGQRVLLKANLLRAASPEEMVSTHPLVVKAVVKLVQEAGGSIVIGDSPGGPFSGAWMRSVYHRCGMTQVAEECGVELNSNYDYTLVSHPDGHIVKALEIADFVSSADVIITLPKLKTHTFMQFTGASKILFGAIPGTFKMGYHTKFPEPERFGDMLVDILTLLKPSLAIMDGIVGMDGDGPSAGHPFETGAVLASADSIALDVVAASMVGMHIGSIPPLAAAVQRGLSSGRLDDIEVLGNSVNEMKVQGFSPPDTQRSRSKVMQTFYRLLKKWMVPAPYAGEDCIGCGICAQNCPVNAIQVVDKHAHMDLDVCIRCYCCHELCPEKVVELRKPWLGRLLT